MKSTTGLALLAAAIPIAVAAPAAASPGKNSPGASPSNYAVPDLARRLHIDFLHDRRPDRDKDWDHGQGNDKDHIPHGKGWGWWKHHRPHPVSP
jgi:hypothetical protein